MRVISQDGLSEFPIDKYGLSIGYNGNMSEFCILARPVYCESKGIKLATYSTEDRAKKSLEMLHEAYSQNQFLSKVVTGYLSTETERHENIECFFDQVRDSFVWCFPSEQEMEDER